MISVQLITSKEDLQKAFAIREKVFIEEQQVDRSEEFDAFEEESYHFIAFNDGLPAGASRWRKTAKGVKLERFAVLPEFRGKGIGSSLVAATLDHINAEVKQKGTALYMHAQLDAVPLYEKHGFKKVGKMFEECDIQHFEMQKII